MKKFIYALIVCLAGFQSTYATPPGCFMRLNEIQKVLASPELVERLDVYDMIESIHHKNNGYIIDTNAHRIEVDIIHLPPTHCGYPEFELFFHDPVPIYHAQPL